jgi:hypothetical protein
MSCTCGTPSKANYFVQVITESPIGETDYSYWYLCAEHAPCDDSVKEWAETGNLAPGHRVIELDEYSHLR